MSFSRRDFPGVTAAAAVIRDAEVRGLGQPQLAQDDPLGVRKDFPALHDYTFLNTAYTGLISQAVVDAAREWTSTRAGRGYTVGEMLAKADDVRRLYAELFGAGEDEIAFPSSTSEGENLVVNSIDFKAGDNVVYDDLVCATLPFGDLYELHAALKYLQGVGLARIEARSQVLVQQLRAGLAERKVQLATAENTSLPTRVRVAVSFFNNEADVDRMLDAATKLSAS